MKHRNICIPRGYTPSDRIFRSEDGWWFFVTDSPKETEVVGGYDSYEIAKEMMEKWDETNNIAVAPKSESRG